MIRKEVALCFIFFCCINYSMYAQEIDSLAMSIDAKVAKMNAEENWEDIVSFEIDNFASKEAFLELYYLEGSLKKMDLSRFDVYSKRENTYYLENGQLIYVSEKSSEYETAIDSDSYSDKDNFVYEAFSYFHQDVLVLQIDSEYTGSSLSKEFLEALGNSILDDFEVLIQLSQTSKE